MKKHVTFGCAVFTVQLSDIETLRCFGHAKLRGRVLRRWGCRKPVQCQCGCYVMKQHCLWCVQACKN